MYPTNKRIQSFVGVDPKTCKENSIADVIKLMDLSSAFAVIVAIPTSDHNVTVQGILFVGEENKENFRIMVDHSLDGIFNTNNKHGG